MPQSVVIAIPPSVGFDAISRIAQELASERAMQYSDADQRHDTARTIAVFRADRRDHLFIAELVPAEEVARDYAEDYADRSEVDARLRARAQTLSYVSVTFADLDTVRAFVSRLFRWLIAEGIDGWMDTDYGEVIAGRDVLRHLDDNPNWDWRYHPFAAR